MPKTKQLPVREKIDEYHGSCGYFRLVPDIAAKGDDAVNILMTFEDGLKLGAAIQSALFTLNRYNRATKAGKQMGLRLSLKTKSGSLSVWHGKLRKPRKEIGKGAASRNGES